MTGKRVRLRNPDGSQVDYFSDLRTSAVDQPSGAIPGIHPIIPLPAFSTGGVNIDFFNSEGGIVLLNPNPFPVEVKTAVTRRTGGPFPGSIIQIPAIGVCRGDGFLSFGTVTANFYASAPLRMLGFSRQIVGGPVGGLHALPPTRVAYPTRDVRFFVPDPLTWEWQIGVLPPLGKTIYVEYTSENALAVYGTLEYSVSVNTFSGGAWLKAVRVPGTTAIQVSVEPSPLGPGVYNGIVTSKSVGAPDIVANVSLTVASMPFVSVPDTLGWTLERARQHSARNRLR